MRVAREAFFRIGQRGGLLFIQAKVVVIPGQHTSLENGGSWSLKQIALHAGFLQQRPGDLTLRIAPHQPHQSGLRPQLSQVTGHVGSPSQDVRLIADFQQGNRSLIRHAEGMAIEVGVQHDVADDQHPCTGKTPNALKAALDSCFHGSYGSDDPAGPSLNFSGSARVNSFSSSSQMMWTTARWDS